MTLETMLTMAATHPLHVLLLGAIVLRGLRVAVRQVVDGLPARPDADRRPESVVV